MGIKVSASILSADLSNLENEIKRLEVAGVDYIHFDVMDGNFVPNITFGMPLIKSARKHTKLPFDVHLMIANPHLYIESFANAGADIISVHAETCTHLNRTLELIKSYVCRAGVVLNPATSEDVIKYSLDKLDYVIVMTVDPGFAGQKFQVSQIAKVKRIRAMSDEVEICVDGGINGETAKLAIDAGADTLVSASYLFEDDNIEVKVKELKKGL